MRAFLLVINVLVALSICAQPGEIFPLLHPCGVLPYHEVDLTDDGIPDLLIAVRSEGTDDEPSSSGTCSIVVRCATGTQLLSANEGTGPDTPAVLPEHGLLNTGPLEYDQNLPARYWYMGEVLVKHWGYGTTALSDPYEQPDLQQQVFIARSQNAANDVLTAFRIDVDQESPSVTVPPLAQAPYGSILSW